MKEFSPYVNKRERDRPPVHPTLLALSIVISLGEDLRRINLLHPRLKSHIYYDPGATFPQDISNMLLPSADRWWERLGEPEFMTFLYCLAYKF